MKSGAKQDFIVASIPLDQNEGKSRVGGKPPVSAHPAFPAIVALWFAALLGIGTLIVPVQLIEQFISATGIAGVVSSAAPPLGFTARAAIALVATILGALLGLFAARRMTVRTKAPFAIARKDSGMRALNPVEDLDDDFLDADLPPLRETPPPSGRRRSLAIAEDETRSDFLELAPLPGNAANRDLQDDALELDAEYLSEDDLEDDPVQDGLDQAPVRQEFMPSAPVPQSMDDLIAEELAAQADGSEPPLEIASVAIAQPVHANTGAKPLAFSPPSLARQAEAESGAFTNSETMPFEAAHSEETFVEQADGPDQDAEPTNEVSVPETPTFDDGEATRHEIPAAFGELPHDGADHEKTASQAATGEDTVGLVQLVQQLGSTLEKHREWSAQRAAAAQIDAEFAAKAEVEAGPAAEAVSGNVEITQEFSPAAPDDAAEAMAAYFGKPAEPAQQLEEAEPDEPAPVAGSSYQPFAGMGRLTVVDDEDSDVDDNEMNELAASFSLSIGSKIRDDAAGQAPSPRPSFDIPPGYIAASADDEAGVAEAAEAAAPAPASQPASDASYRSLSQINNPFKRSAEEFVRVEEPESEAGSNEPAVLFPNQQSHKPSAGSPADASATSKSRAFDPPSGEPAPASPFAPVPAAPTAARNPAAHEDNEQALRAALMNLQRMAK
ncbi:sulfite exporter TauE/SafE family protein [Aurantiacibacter marinus]|uniref:sulfite exporter TauE/SafE family protein n=1 Tax=Aurantiacibacter marinus TaxID=874156 RepID=UPI000A5CF491|nr:sulfite exporter TauE/SafE family protein [Aurantiacibacter marinus]